jgi:hypothetical protein
LLKKHWRYNKLVKKRGITIKIPRSQLEGESTHDKIREYLQKNSKDAYTIMGLMVELFGAKAEDLNGPFKDWSEGMPSLYTRVRLALEKLRAEKLIDSKKHGKAYFYFWRGRD